MNESEPGAPATRRLPAIGALCIALAVSVAVAAAESVAVGAYFAKPARLTTDFSPALLQRQLQALAAASGQVVFLGDSVLWGFRLPARDNAVSILAARGLGARNFSFKAGSPANYYALTRLILDRGIRPRCVVLEINQKTFNQADAAYQALHPAVASLAYPLLDGGDRAALALSPPADNFGSRFDRVLSSLWLAYAMRSDVRDALQGDRDAAPADASTPGAFEGTYDLAPLTGDNVAVHFLRETLQALQAARVPVLAFMTPTNHALLHDYIDNPQYRANGTYLQALVRRYGGRVLDLDARLPSGDFLDNDHLTARGQLRLAAALEVPLRSALGVHLANDR